MGDRLRGMVLAAGYGTRLAPLTDHVPKPLLMVHGATLLDRAIASLARAGCGAVAVNTHHRGTMLARHLEGASPPVTVRVFPEAEILGTGGALDGARAFLAEADAFCIHNADVLFTGSLDDVVRGHGQHRAVATLLVTDWPEVNSVVLASDGEVLSLRGKGDGRRLTYTGIGIFSRAILDEVPTGFSSLADILERCLQELPGSVRAVVTEAPWSDLGTPGRYLKAVDDRGEGSGALRVEPLLGQGSDRRFWRLAAGDWSAVAMRDVPGSEEFSRQISIGRRLHAAGLGAAEILAVDLSEQTVVMEDLGRRDLWSVAAELGTDPGPWCELYAPVVDHLLTLQFAGNKTLRDLSEAWDRSLDQDALRWETDYFRTRFLVGHLGWAEADLADLDPEFAALARSVAAQPQVLIHRDFQSRNILLPGGRVRLVDVQGMRSGPLLYDLASLLWDPYVSLPVAARQRLRERFAGGLGVGCADPGAVRTMFLAASLQRLMQVLGAFGFLGHVKGKTEYLAHIPRAVANLKLALAQLGTDHGCASNGPGPLPRLTTLVDRAAALCPCEETDD
ncbi:hypothetical protein CO151_11390 [bacterium CG_4_9_14_3_um_filter_65_15]|nr:MAG: hypothetical protein CO151_11390 [bacterium CG_4_9_14_3_um_filter_65_15]